MRKVILIFFIVCITLFFLTRFDNRVEATTTALPRPQSQFFHAHLAAQTLPDNGTTTVATISFTTNRPGAIDATSEQEAMFQSFSNDVPVGSGDPCNFNGQQDTLTAQMFLDGVAIETITKPQLIPPQAYQCEAADLGITTTHAVTTGTHTLTVVYTSATNPNPPLFLKTMLVEEGTISLDVETLATSN